MIRLLLVDDQPLFVESLKLSIEGYADDLTVVGIAEDGSAAVTMAAELKPDVILMDVHLPDFSGVQATEQILKENHAVNPLSAPLNAKYA